MSKLRAFLIHFAISATVVGSALAIIFFVWYPAPWFEISGAWHVVRVLIGVDLIIGPLLTLILFRSGKPGLKFDLSVIALIQLAALTYGLSVIYVERPYYVVFAVDRFEVLASRDVDEAQIANTAFEHKPWAEPVYAVAKLPADEAGRQQLLDDVLDGKPDIDRRPEFWYPYSTEADTVIKAATPLTELARLRPDVAAYIARAGGNGEPATQLVGVPVNGKEASFYLILDTHDARPVGLIPVDPWQSPAEPAPKQAAAPSR